jgi:hypothetical protein
MCPYPFRIEQDVDVAILVERIPSLDIEQRLCRNVRMRTLGAPDRRRKAGALTLIAAAVARSSSVWPGKR